MRRWTQPTDDLTSRCIVCIRLSLCLSKRGGRLGANLTGRGRCNFEPMFTGHRAAIAIKIATISAYPVVIITWPHRLSPFYAELRGATRHAKESSICAPGDCFDNATETTIKAYPEVIITWSHRIRPINTEFRGSTRHMKESPKGHQATVYSIK